jgi:uncharacterized protein YjbI with pentapeptide repeats
MTDRRWFTIAALAATVCGLAATAAGVHLADAESGHQVGAALTATGTSVVGGGVIGLLLGLAQLLIDDRRSARETQQARLDTIRHTLNTTPILPGIDLSGLDLAGVYLRGKDFSDGELSEADLSGATMFGCVLVGTRLSGTKLVGTDLREANLTGADLTGADLRGARLEDAVLNGVEWDDSTVWPQGYEPVAAD